MLPTGAASLRQLSSATKFPSLISLRKYCDHSYMFSQNEEKWNKLCRDPYWSCTSVNARNASHLRQLKNVDFMQVKEIHRKKQYSDEIEQQKYCEDRVKYLGADLAALHYFTYRQCAVKMKNSHEWITGSLTTLATYLPHTYIDGYYVEAIDCSDFQPNGIRYEGLENLRNLRHLKWLSLKNQKHINSWCLDRIAALNGDTLEYLDISSCDLDIGCVVALGKMRKLETLIITLPDNMTVLQALAYLEYKSPHLIIKTDEMSEEERECTN